MFKKAINRLFENKIRLPLVLIVAGILLRYLLMPISAHPDLISATWREHLWVFHSQFLLGDLSETLLAGYMKIAGVVFSAGFHQLFWRLDTLGGSGDIATIIKSYHDFVDSAHGMRYLFFLKLPYLFFDVASLYFVWQLFQERAKRIIALAFWAFNPLVLYAVFMWGRYEIFPIFFTTIAIYLAKNKKRLWPIFFLGLAIATRMPFIFLLPFFIIYCAKSWKDVILSLILAFLPIMFFGQLNQFIGGESLASGLERGGFLTYITVNQIGAGFSDISLFLLLYPLVIFLYWRQRREENFSFNKLISYSTIAMLIFYINAKYHPHYISWLSPLLMVMIAENKKLIWPFLGLAAVFFFYVESNWGQGVTFGLLTPLNNGFFGNLLSVYHQMPFLSIPQQAWQNIAQTAFAFFGIIMIYFIYQNRNAN